MIIYFAIGGISMDDFAKFSNLIGRIGALGIERMEGIRCEKKRGEKDDAKSNQFL